MKSSKSVLAVVFAVVACGVLALGAGSAFAELSYPFDGQLAPSGGGSFGHLEAGSVAVNDSNGDTYVADSASGVVDVFDTASGSQLAGLDSSSTPGGSLGSQVEVAANNGTGDVYVLDSRDNVVDVFNSLGAYQCQITGRATPSASECNGVAGSATPAGAFNDPGGIAVDQATGEIYVVDAFNGVVDVFSSAGGYLRQIPLASVEDGFNANYTRGIAVNDFNGDVYVSDSGSPNPLSEDAVYVFNASGEYLSTWTGANTPATSFGNHMLSVAADNTKGLVYVTETRDEVTDVFESSGSYDGQFSQSYENPLGTAVDQASGKVFVSDQSAVDIFGPGVVPPPSIDSATAVNVMGTSADLTANINPKGLASTYRFVYGTSTAYGSSVPVPDGDIAPEAGDQRVTQHVSGLQTDTTYHWRVVAQNAVGTTTGIDHTFIYDTSGEGLPDNRAYEMVSPPQKNGALIGRLLFGLLPEVSEDGARVLAPSVQCFAGAGSCTATRGLQGDPVAFTRTSGGWVASALAPPASQIQSNTSGAYDADTGDALFDVPTPPSGEDDIYLRRADGSVADIGPKTPPSAGALGPVGEGSQTTADFSHVAYTIEGEGGTLRWPFDATLTGPSLYEYVGVGNTAPLLVGVSGGPGSTDLISVCGTALATGPRGDGGVNSMSSDGRTVFFTASSCASGSGANAGVEVPANMMYARIDESRTVLISGRSPHGCTGACLSSTPGGAVFQYASTDGSRVFFTSRQRLTDDASEGEENLYEYDFSRPAGESLSVISAGDTSGGGPGVTGVEAVSSDGSHIYFTATGVLTSTTNGQGQLPQGGAENLYVYERDTSYPEGRVAFIAVLPATDNGFTFGEREGRGFNSAVGLANVTPDGRFLVFMSHGRLTPGDEHNTRFTQVFRYDAQTGELARISTGEHGFNDDGNEGLGDASIVPSETSFPRPDPTMSHDGSFVFFESPIALTPRALNDVQIAESTHQGSEHLPSFAQNVYEWHEGHVYLISDGKDTTALSFEGSGAPPTAGESSVQLLGSDATGENVFFRTDDRLVAQDTDTELDYYDARICSTSDPCVSAPSAAALPCQGEGCRGAPGVVPSLAMPVSASFSGVGNQASTATPAVKTKKAKAKKKKVKSRKAKHRKQARGKGSGKRGKAKRSSRSTRRSK